MENSFNIYSRIELLFGKGFVKELNSKKVIIFGVGGVGSWCAEGLLRNGIINLTLVDSDNISESNCNRQLMATSKTIGKSKVEVLKQRLLEINPSANIEACHKVYCKENHSDFKIENYDYCIDAIDSLKNKMDLILWATSFENVTLFSSMGAALRIDPFMIRKAEFWKVNGDPLARALRKKMKGEHKSPAKKFFCIYSEEKPKENLGKSEYTESNINEPNANWDKCKAQINGSLCHITSIFGFSLAGMVMEDIEEKFNKRC